MIFRHNTRTLLRCRLLNKMKGMKPTRELYLRRRPQTGTRKCLTGPTPEKDNAAKPEAPRYNNTYSFETARFFLNESNADKDSAIVYCGIG